MDGILHENQGSVHKIWKEDPAKKKVQETQNGQMLKICFLSENRWKHRKEF